jgi:uncharacterized protein YndB with AHSA1/START domain
MTPAKVGTEKAISFQRTYAASKERVFQAWIDPEALKQWFGPHDDFKIPTVEVDARVGGKYRFVLVSPDGNNNTVGGMYKEIQPGEKLAFTWSWEEGGMDIGETLVTVEFKGEGNQTEVSITHELLPTEEARQAHSDGWNGTLTRLERYL